MPCETCNYLDGQKCKRFPPSIGPSNQSQWPHVNSSDWCGEYQLSSTRCLYCREKLNPDDDVDLASVRGSHMAHVKCIEDILGKGIES